MDYVLDIAERERESEEMAPKRERELGHSREREAIDSYYAYST